MIIMRNENNNTINISIDVFKDLIRDAYKFRALDEGGVDNWAWYDEALSNGLEKYNIDDYDELAEEIIKKEV